MIFMVRYKKFVVTIHGRRYACRCTGFFIFFENTTSKCSKLSEQRFCYWLLVTGTGLAQAICEFQVGYLLQGIKAWRFTRYKFRVPDVELKYRMSEYRWNCLDEPVLIARPKLLVDGFLIHHRLDWRVMTYL